MLNRSAKPQPYAESVANVEITLPDDLLDQIDVAAERAGLARDELIRRAMEEDVTRRGDAFRAEMEELLGPPVPMGGNAVEIIREMRDNWPPIRRGNLDEE
jgi:hypothetical protein